MPKITRGDVRVPADVPADAREAYIDNYMAATRGTGRLMLFAADQKIEHLNDDFYGEGISEADADPEHLFRIATQGLCGIMAAQRGLVSLYGADYPDVNYLVKMNSKSHLVKTKQSDPLSAQLYDIGTLAELIDNGVNVVGVGYTIYLGSEFEATMISEAGQLIADAHAMGLIVVLWMYPRGQAVENEKDAHLIAGAAGVACILGSDFVKVNPPKGNDAGTSAELLREAAASSGRTGLVCAGGSTVDPETFLTQLVDQIHTGGAVGNATGRNIHQRDLAEAVRLTKAISAVTYGDYDAARAMKVFLGEEDYACEL